MEVIGRSRGVAAGNNSKGLILDTLDAGYSRGGSIGKPNGGSVVYRRGEIGFKEEDKRFFRAAPSGASQSAKEV